MGWAQEKSAIGLKEYGEWNRDEVHPTFFDDEDISTQGTDFEHGWTDGRASGVLCIIKKGTLEGPIA